MACQVIFAERVLTPLEEFHAAAILVDGTTITEVGPRRAVKVPRGCTEIAVPQTTVVPGFVDIHINGAGGRDAAEATPDALDALTRTAARFGTTSILATVITSDPKRLADSLRGISSYVAKRSAAPLQSLPAAQILGIHVEGPFINRQKRGVHPEVWAADPSVPLLERLLDAGAGHLRMITLAPELPGSAELIDLALRRGIIVSLGHSNATYDQARSAIDCGARNAVHVFNAMRPFSHRETGIIGAVLTDRRIVAEVIADGVHVDPPAVMILIAAKGADRVILVSDSISAAGMPDGEYPLGPLTIRASAGIPRDDAGRLAGSTLTLDQALRNVVSWGVPLQQALTLLTRNPAALLGLEASKGAIIRGADADLVFLTAGLRVAAVMTRGVFQGN